MCAAILTVSEIDSIDILVVNKSYPILYTSSIVRGASCIILMADHIVKIYMPDVTDSEDQDNLILTINTRSEKYNLINTGRCEEENNIHKFRLEPYSNT